MFKPLGITSILVPVLIAQLNADNAQVTVNTDTIRVKEIRTYPLPSDIGQVYSARFRSIVMKAGTVYMDSMENTLAMNYSPRLRQDRNIHGYHVAKEGRELTAVEANRLRSVVLNCDNYVIGKLPEVRSPEYAFTFCDGGDTLIVIVKAWCESLTALHNDYVIARATMSWDGRSAFCGLARKMFDSVPQRRH